MKALIALGIVLAIIIGILGLVFVLAIWTDWALNLPEPWSELLSPLAALGCLLLVAIFSAVLDGLNQK